MEERRENRYSIPDYVIYSVLAVGLGVEVAGTIVDLLPMVLGGGSFALTASIYGSKKFRQEEEQKLITRSGLEEKVEN